MARDKTRVKFNDKYFADIMNSAQITELSLEAGQAVLNEARATAPVDTEDYKNRLHLKVHQAKYRKVVMVVGDDRKTLLVEAKTGNLARALKRVKKQ